MTDNEQKVDIKCGSCETTISVPSSVFLTGKLACPFCGLSVNKESNIVKASAKQKILCD